VLYSVVVKKIIAVLSRPQTAWVAMLVIGLPVRIFCTCYLGALAAGKRYGPIHTWLKLFRIAPCPANPNSRTA